VNTKDCRKDNGNCSQYDEGGIPVQCIHDWSREKHDRVAKYIEASAGPRRWWLDPSRGGGGAAYIDLFAGPGRARVQEGGEFVDGSPLIALKHTKSPFTKLIFCELDEENVSALSRRIVGDKRAVVVPGDCNETIEKVAALVPPSGLNLALIDPFRVSHLKFATVERLGHFKYMDLLIHFPSSHMKRQIGKELFDHIDAFFASDDWRSKLPKMEDVPRLLIAAFRRRLALLGYSSEDVHSEPVRGSSGNVLYYMVYLSKDKKGDQIWNALTKTTAAGQRRIF